MGENHDISPAADQDLSEIFDYTEENYGTSQAIAYLEELYHVFTELGSTPGMGRKRDEIRRGLRSFPKNSHMIFYRLRSRRVWIVRVISMQRDIMRIFTLKDPRLVA
jgi:toxin ParE1/3/4